MTLLERTAVDESAIGKNAIGESAASMSATSEKSGAAGFRQAMREFASGVAIIACGEGVRRTGCTATALASLSLTPPTLVVCLDKGGSTIERLRESGAFSVNLLAAQHEGLAARFAGKTGAQGADRFSEGDWIQLVTGAPLLADALAAIDCRVEEIVDRHTHAIVIGAVAAVRLGASDPALLHWRSRFEQHG